MIKMDQLVMPESLVVVGVGIKSVSDASHGAKVEIEEADKVLYLVTEPVTALWIKKLNSSAESLFPFYDKRNNS